MPQDEGSDSSDDSDEEADAAADRRAQETSRNLDIVAGVHGIFLVYPGTCWHIVVVCIVVNRGESVLRRKSWISRSRIW